MAVISFGLDKGFESEHMTQAIQTRISFTVAYVWKALSLDRLDQSPFLSYSGVLFGDRLHDRTFSIVKTSDCPHAGLSVCKRSMIALQSVT